MGSKQISDYSKCLEINVVGTDFVPHRASYLTVNQGRIWVTARGLIGIKKVENRNCIFYCVVFVEQAHHVNKQVYNQLEFT